jgi:hypothetical protein
MLSAPQDAEPERQLGSDAEQEKQRARQNETDPVARNREYK